MTSEDEIEQGWQLLEHEDLEGARALALKVAASEPASADAALLLAGCARQSDDNEAALTHLQAAIVADPEWATPELWMAEILSLDDERLVEAHRHAARAVELADEEDEYLEALLLRAQIEVTLGKIETARATLADLPPPDDVELPAALVCEAAELLITVDEAAEATLRLDTLLEREPDHAEAWYLSGVAAEAQSDEAGRRTAWAKTLDLDRAELAKVDPDERLSEEEIAGEAERALAELPKEARALLANVPIVIAELPAAGDVAEGADPRAPGLFSGTPLSEDAGGPAAEPELKQIVLFRRNLERMATNEESLREEIRASLLNEIGHFFGLEDESDSESILD